MIWKQTQCELLCKAIARLRAGGRCELSGVSTDTVHHIFYGKQWEGNYKARYNHLFFIPLSTFRHLHRADAPHVNNNIFFKVLEKKLYPIDPDRLISIMTFRNNPDRDPGKPDWEKILLELRAVHKSYDDTAWMDDIDVAPGVCI